MVVYDVRLAHRCWAMYLQAGNWGCGVEVFREENHLVGMCVYTGQDACMAISSL